MKRFNLTLLILVFIAVLWNCGGHFRFIHGSGESTTVTEGSSVTVENPVNPITVPVLVTPTPIPQISPVPTATPIPTATPNPTATPTSTPTPIPGMTPIPITDLLSQTHSDKTDIVWVIDNSGSMGQEQNLIQANAVRFTAKLFAANVDWRLIVVTTDASYDRDLRNKCSAIIDSAHSGDFAACALVGVEGITPGIPDSANQEEGLEAARRALDPNYMNGPLNPNFLRSDADLQLIFVSDEEDEPNPASWWDRSVALRQELRNEMTLDLADPPGRWRDGREAYFPLLSNHENFFRGLKAGSGREVHAHAIVMKDVSGPIRACNHRNTSQEIGQRYITFAGHMGGSTADICGDWTVTMDELGLQASGLKKCFALTQRPWDIAQIVAMVNGTVPADGFIYVSAENQVCFNTIPPDGAAITISYSY